MTDTSAGPHEKPLVPSPVRHRCESPFSGCADGVGMGGPLGG